MKICNAHDEEVCHESHNCPACEIKSELDDALSELKDLEEKYAELEAKLESTL